MKPFMLGLILAFAFLLAGCFPERVLWSPDGSQALILGDDGLHLGTPDGKLGPVLVKSGAPAAWLPDGKSFLACSPMTFNSWKEFAGASGIGPDKQAVDALRKELVDGDEKAIRDLSDDALSRAGLYLRDNEPGIVSQLNSRHDLLDKDRKYTPEVCQRYDLDGGKAVPGPILFWGGESHTLELRVSHSGKYVAVADVKYGEQNGPPPELWVVPAHPQTGAYLPLDLGPSGAFPDWDSAGNAVIYYRREDHDSGLAAISRQIVLDDKGELLHKDLPAREDLAGVIFDELGRVRCAADGRIFFSAMSVTLPAGPHDVPNRASLFMIQPAMHSTVTRVVPRNTEESLQDPLMQFFELSPDGQWISIPLEQGGVAAMAIADGQLAPNLDGPGFKPSDQTKMSSVPTWRAAHELTYVRWNGEVPEVVRCDVSDPQHTTVVMSATWGTAVKGDWLKPATKAATAPATAPAAGMP